MTYEQRKRAALEALALEIAFDPRSSPADVAAARAQLAGERPADFKRLSEAELQTWRALQAKLAGRPTRDVALVLAIDSGRYHPPCSRCSKLRPAELRELDSWITDPERSTYDDEEDADEQPQADAPEAPGATDDAGDAGALTDGR